MHDARGGLPVTCPGSLPLRSLPVMLRHPSLPWSRSAPAALSLVVLLVGCRSADRPTEPTPIASISLPQRATVHLGETLRVAVAARDVAGKAVNGRRFHFSSQDPEIASVDSMGVVTPGLAGTTTITVTSEGVSASMPLTVHPPRVTAVRFAVTGTMELNKGDTVTVLPELIDRTGAPVERAARYHSASPIVATVDSTGRVTGQAVGTALITAEVDGAKGSYLVSVVHFPRPASMVVRPATVALLPESVGRLWVNAADSSGGRFTGGRLAFASSDTSVAIVSADGTVTGRAPGSALVTTTLNGTTATTTVRVEASEAGKYVIDLIFDGPFADDPVFREVAREAAARWERIIVDDFESHTVSMNAGQCFAQAPAFSVTTTGLVVLVLTDSLGGGIAGYGGPCVLRQRPGDWSISGAPAVGVIQLDSTLVRSYLTSNRTILRDLVTHEIGHVIGIGTRWSPLGQSYDVGNLRLGPETDWRFTGESAGAASANLGYTVPGEYVPLEIRGGAGTAGAHLRSGPYVREVMGGWLTHGGARLTTVTAGMLRDLGYTVQLAGAEVVTVAEVDPVSVGPRIPPGASGMAGVNARLQVGSERRVELRERPWDGPTWVIGRDGKLRRVEGR